MERVNVAITGFGAIGKRVAELLWQRRDRYRAVHEADVRLTAVCGSKAGLFAPDGFNGPSAADLGPMEAGLTGATFLERVGVDVLIDAGPSDYATGGAALGYMRTALLCGMHVIAISKGALVVDHAGLQELADAHRVLLKVSGATSAALPTIDMFDYNLAGCEVSLVEGIFTSTTNFVLSRMMDGSPYAEALQEAQRLGMAEPDPRFDVEGWDTAAKITILANAAFRAGIGLDDIVRDRIDTILPEQIERWRAEGRVPKLVGRIVNDGGGVSASVRLETYPVDHLFAKVGAGMKAVRFETDAMGEITAFGSTGPMVTAAAALKDLEHVLAHRRIASRAR